MKRLANYINGQLVEPIKKDYLDLYNPSKGQVYGEVPSSSEEDVEAAYQAASIAFKDWSKTTTQERYHILAKIASLIERDADKLALAESIDNGKPLSLAEKVDIPRAAQNILFFAQAITQFSSETHEMKDGINYTLRQPIGVVGAISPWNLPLYLFTWKIAPALAAGNTVIAKPSEVTPMTAFLFSEICIEAGLPKGVLNILHGKGNEVGAAITKHPRIKAISFTGSTKIGAQIASTVAPMFKKISLEMGGKNANIIFDDCNYEKMLSTTLRSSFANQGQICLCGSRILVEKTIYEKFVTDFTLRAQQLKVGPPLEKESDLGAIVSQEHFNKIQSYIELAKQEGGIIECGGTTISPKGHEKGWYISPTVITGLPINCRTNMEEIFGPVVTITPFSSKEEAISMANTSDYGLSCTIWSENISTINALTPNIDAGIIWVNTWLHRDLRTPFGGVKNSGVGREGGLEALRFFTQTKNICIQY